MNFALVRSHSRRISDPYGALRCWLFYFAAVESRRTLLDVLEERVHPDRAIVRFDPALNRALDLAKGEGLVEQLGGDRFHITTKGQLFAEKVFEDSDCMKTEKWFLDEVRGRMTEARVTRLLKAVI